MKHNFTALAVSLLAGAFLLSVEAASAQTSASPPPATATRPTKTPSEQNSLPSNAPPASTNQTTGEVSRDPTTRKMNEDEKAKVDNKGK